MGLDVMAKGDQPRLDAVLQGRRGSRGIGITHSDVHDENK